MVKEWDFSIDSIALENIENESSRIEESFNNAIEVMTANHVSLLSYGNIFNYFEYEIMRMSHVMYSHANRVNCSYIYELIPVYAYISALKNCSSKTEIEKHFKREHYESDVSKISEVMKTLFCSFSMNVLGKIESNVLTWTTAKYELNIGYVYHHILQFLKDVPPVTLTILNKYEAILTLLESQITNILFRYKDTCGFFSDMEKDMSESDVMYAKVHMILRDKPYNEIKWGYNNGYQDYRYHR